MSRNPPDRLAALRAAFAGRYELERPAGEGGMATVWLARDLKHDRPVAVKVLRREMGASIGAERFAREIVITARFNHPNIVPVLDSGVLELGELRLPWYSMPYVEGPSLRDHLSRNGPLPLDEALRYAAEVADALDFAHARGVVHRDVKPGNILIQAGHALVADFGIARAVDVASRSSAALTTEGLLGTPIYMSPEQCRGEERIDGRSDIYALGCVMYEMLVGAPPFDAPTPQAVSLAHCTQAPPALEEKRPGVHHAVIELVNRALEKNPADRWATAGEFRAEIERVRSRTSGRTEMVAPLRRRRRHLWWAAAAAVAAATVAGAAWLRARPAPLRPVEGGVVVLGGFRDASGALVREARQLDDALREELRGARMLTVVDLSGQPEQPLDSLRVRYGADWVVTGVLDRSGDSLGVTVRVVDAARANEVGGAATWAREPSALMRLARSYDEGSAFMAIRRSLHAQLAARRLESLEPDSAARALIARAEQAREAADGAFYQLGPTRALQELTVADSLLAEAERRWPRSVGATIHRVHLAEYRGAIAYAGRERFADSSTIESPEVGFRQGLAHAGALVKRAPTLPDGWQLRARLAARVAEVTKDPTLLDQARADLQRAAALGSTRPQMWMARADLEQLRGSRLDALFAMRRAEELDVLHVSTSQIRRSRFDLELSVAQWDSAAATCRRARADMPRDPLLRTCESELAAARSTSPADAVEALRLADSIDAGGALNTSGAVTDALRFGAAAVLWRAGLADSGEAVYTRTLARWTGALPWTTLLDASAARVARGDLDSALVLASLAVRTAPAVASQLQTHARFEPLRAHPKFGDALGGVPPAEAGGRAR